MSTLHPRWALVAGLLAFAGCGNRDEAPPPEPPPAAPSPEPTPAPAADDVLPSAEVLPVPDDFEDEAATEVTESTYRAELDAIEKDIEADVTADGRE